MKELAWRNRSGVRLHESIHQLLAALNRSEKLRQRLVRRFERRELACELEHWHGVLIARFVASPHGVVERGSAAQTFVEGGSTAFGIEERVGNSLRRDRVFL